MSQGSVWADEVRGVCDEGFTGPAGGPCTDVNECTPNSGKGKGMGTIPQCN